MGTEHMTNSVFTEVQPPNACDVTGCGPARQERLGLGSSIGSCIFMSPSLLQKQDTCDGWDQRGRHYQCAKLQVALLWRPGCMLLAGDVCMNLMRLADPVGFEDLDEGRASQRKLSFIRSCWVWPRRRTFLQTLRELG
jgi:hypothetical protein